MGREVWVANVKGYLKHETESPRPLHFQHSHWWKRRSMSKFASHYVWGTSGVCESKMDVKFTRIPTWHPMDHVAWSLGLFSKNHLLDVGLTQNRETMALRMLSTVALYYFYRAWGLAWIEIHWNSIWLRALATYGFTLNFKVRDHTTWVWRCFGTALGHFILGSHNAMVTALGSCVKWS